MLVAQLLYLANDDPEKDITLYINSPGGSVSAGMAIYDAMQVRACARVCVCLRLVSVGVGNADRPTNQSARILA